MAIILRGNKGTPLSHNELDNNFRQFFYSASYSGTLLTLHTTASLDNQVEIPLPAPHGRDGYIQVKSGNAPSGSEVEATSSKSFLYDYHTSELRLTGSLMVRAQMTGSGGTALIVSGNQFITEDLVVGGTVTAEEFITEKIATSYIYKSGSTKFGDTADDTHAFTGSLEIVGSVTGSDVQIDDWGSISGSLASNLNYSFEASKSLAGDITANSSSAAATYLLNTTDTFTGDLTVTGRINATEISTTYVTSSILYNSGSNIFGDAVNDKHIFTGSIATEQSITGSDIRINEWGSVSASLSSLDTTITGLSTDYPDLTNIPSGIISQSALYAPPVQGILSLQTNGATQTAVNIYGLQTTSTPSFADLTLTNFSSVSASLAALTAGTITINNDADNRVITANGDSTLNGESNLLFNGNTLFVKGTEYGEYSVVDTDITGLIDGSTQGTIIQGDANGHVVVGIRGNDTSDSFSIISGDGDYYSNTTYDKLVFRAKANGETTIGGNTVISGSLNVTDDVIAYSSSDIALKDNVELITQPLDKIKKIKGVSFDWNDKSKNTGHDIGVIAQDIEAVLPELVKTKDDGYKAVRYEKIVALLIEAVKEQQSQIEDLKNRL